MVQFQQNENTEQVEVHLEDRQTAVKRRYKYSHFGLSGQRLKLESLTQRHFVYHAVHFDQSFYLENNQEKSCRNYPNDDFCNYDECGEDFIKRGLEESYAGDFFCEYGQQTTCTKSLQEY